MWLREFGVLGFGFSEETQSCPGQVCVLPSNQGKVQGLAFRVQGLGSRVCGRIGSPAEHLLSTMKWPLVHQACSLKDPNVKGQGR